jgi:ADP-ribosyl-[dinitrogen reductase] hydrolase
MKSDYTHISVILDRTGSMGSIRDDTIGGYNTYLEKQQDEPGEATLTLVQFDSQDPYEVIHHFLPIRDVPNLTRQTYVPRGSTPLLDAIGRGINDLEQSLATLPDGGRPSQVVMAIVTDGEENASLEFTRTQIAQMIQEKQKQLDWQFVFLSADLNAIDDAEANGVLPSHAMAYDQTASGTRDAWGALSARTSDFRAGRQADMSFIEHDRRQQQSEQLRATRSQAQTGESSMGSNNRRLLDALIAQGVVNLNWGPILDSQPALLPVRSAWDRVEGMLLGLAIGDSLGNTTEAQIPHTRRAKYGEIRDYLPNLYAGNRPVGTPSDDTQMAFWLLEQMLEDSAFNPDKLAQKYTSRKIFGIGVSVKQFIRNYKDQGKSWQQAAVMSAGNGALMRIAPILVSYMRQPSPDLYVDAALASTLTHNDRGSTAACVAFVAMLWDLLGMDQPPAPEWWVRRYVEIARPLEGDQTQFQVRERCTHPVYQQHRGPLWRFVEEHVLAAWQQRVPVLEACNGWYSGAYLLETLPTALYILMHHAHEPEEAIVRSVNDSYDNDTVAAIVGAAVGALHGKRALPARWQTDLLGRTMADDDGHIFDLIAAAKVRWA